MTTKLRTFEELFKLLEEPQASAIVRFYEGTKQEHGEMPASIGRHHSYPGGYRDHILEVTNNIVTLHENLVLGEAAHKTFTLSEAVAAAFLHDVDKLLYRYERSSSKPTQPQLGKAASLGLVIHDLETKESLSEKISAAIEGRTIDEARLPRHSWRKEALSMEDGAAVCWLCARFRIPLTEQMVHAISFHHGGYNPYIREMPAIQLSPLATLLHMADLASSKIQNGAREINPHYVEMATAGAE